jgi:hypothetical protein
MSRFLICLSLAALAACGPPEKPDVIDPAPPPPAPRPDCAQSMFEHLRDADLAQQDPETRSATIREVISSEPLFQELGPEQQEKLVQNVIASYDACLQNVAGGAGQGPCLNAQTVFPLCRDDVCTDALVCVQNTCCQTGGHGPAFKCAAVMCCDDYAGGNSRLSYACVL